MYYAPATSRQLRPRDKILLWLQFDFRGLSLGNWIIDTKCYSLQSLQFTAKSKNGVKAAFIRTECEGQICSDES